MYLPQVSLFLGAISKQGYAKSKQNNFVLVCEFLNFEDFWSLHLARFLGCCEFSFLLFQKFIEFREITRGCVGVLLCFVLKIAAAMSHLEAVEEEEEEKSLLEMF